MASRGCTLNVVVVVVARPEAHLDLEHRGEYSYGGFHGNETQSSFIVAFVRLIMLLDVYRHATTNNDAQQAQSIRSS